MNPLSRLKALVGLCACSAAVLAAPLPETSQARRALADLDSPFEGNVGQHDARVAYATRTFSGATFVTHDGELVHAVRGAAGTTGWNLVERFAGATVRPWPKAPSATGVSRLMNGRLRDIPTFHAISLGEAWPGVEVSLQAKGANVEKLFTVAPGADAARIRVSLEGAKSLKLDESGALEVATDSGPVRFSAPIAWQRIGGERRAVPVSYVVGGMEYGFRVGAHDRNAPVVIDPLLQSTYLGGGSPMDLIDALRVDAAGNVYVAGGTSSFDFPGTAGGAQPSPAGFGIYAAKLSADLKTLIQATYLGGDSNESVGGMVLDGAGNVIIAGSTSSSSFPGTTGAAQAVYGGGPGDGFVMKLSGDLKSILQSTFVGGSGQDEIASLAMDAAGNFVVAGQSNSGSLPGSAGSAQPANAGAYDAFVARFSADLKTLVRATYLGGSGDDRAIAVAIDSGGFIYVAGGTSSTNFPATSGGARAVYGGGIVDPFIARLSPDLATLHQSTYLGGGNLIESLTGIAIAADGRIYAAGWTDSFDFPGTTGGAQPTKPGTGSAAFVARVANDLKSIVQSTYLGGSDTDSANGILIDAAGKVFIAGSARSKNFPGAGPGAGGTDAFVAVLEPDLKSIARSIVIGGAGDDSATRLAFDPSGNVILGGSTSGAFPGTSGGAQSTLRGSSDAFIARMTADLSGGPAARLEVSAPGSAAVGTSFNVTVRAVDSLGAASTAYSGTVHFTSTDPAATLPADATLTNGMASFPVTMSTAGTRTITVTDTVTASITGTSAAIQVSPRPATHFTVSAPTLAVADVAVTVTVTARDALGSVATGYTCCITVSSTDPAAGFSGLGSFENGVRTFQMTFRTMGSATVTVTDNASGATGTSGTITVIPPLHFTVSAPATSPAGTPFSITVTARDSGNAVATAFGGTVRITSSDGAAVLPPDAPLVNGTGTFNVTLKTSGDQTVTATDTVNPPVAAPGSANVAVSAGPAVRLSVAAPASTVPDAAMNVVVTARDAFGNASPGYTGTVHLTSTDPAATLPADAALVAGARTFSATLRTLGSQTLTTTEVAGGGLAGTSDPIQVSRLALSTATIDFGGYSMGTTSPARTVTLTNSGATSATISAIALPNAQFAQTNDCNTLAAGATCTVTLVFKPAVTPDALGASLPVTATLSVTSAAGNLSIALLGRAERSLVTHYYRSILLRGPDTGGMGYWTSEAIRLASLGVNVNETWFAMAQAFYSSPEYVVLNRNNTGYATDLYNTFFNRVPDSAGLAFWVGQLDAGMPREVALASFMFSAEFASFTTALFGSTAARAEIDAIVDFYRGLLARIPDTPGFGFFVASFRAAQCVNAAAVTNAVETISSAFANSPEYAARARTNAQYVGDLYNAFLRRGGDLAGVNFWIGQVASGGQTREQVRVQFRNSPEFQARVAAVVSQGCFTP